jgi:hypothetical protein
MEISIRKEVKMLARQFAASHTKEGYAHAAVILSRFAVFSASLESFKKTAIKASLGEIHHFEISDYGNLLMDGSDLSHWAIGDAEIYKACEVLIESL